MRKRFIMAALLGAAVSAGASQAHAALLGYLPGTEDFSVAAVKIDYTASTDQLVITGKTAAYGNNGSATTLTGSSIGTFSLTADISAAGVLESASVTLTGNTTNGNPAITEYSSSVPAGFGYSNDVLTFAFVEDSTAGALITPGALFAMDINAASSGMPTIDFSSNFSNHAAGNPMGPVDTVADVFAVPEPASMSLLGLGALGLLMRRRAARSH